MAYEDLLKIYEKWEDRMQHHGVGNMPFCIAFCGVFSSGKSSLLNALLDCGSVLPTGINPVTKIITRIRYGESVALHCVVDGETIPVPREDLDAVITGKKALPQGCTELVAELPSQILKNNVEFIDTPGYADEAVLEDMSRAAVLTADYIVFCCNATMLGQQFEKQYLQELKQTHGNFCMAVNRMDCLNTDEDFENVKAAAGRLMADCGMAAHPEQKQGQFFLTIAAGAYANLNGFDAYMKTLLGDGQERTQIRRSTNQCFTSFHRKRLLGLIREERASCGEQIIALRREDDIRREKLEVRQNAVRMQLDQSIENARIYANAQIRPKRAVLENKINSLSNPSSFVEDVKHIVREEVRSLIDALAGYSERSRLMSSRRVRNELSRYEVCSVPAPTYREERQRGLVGRAVVSVAVSLLTFSPYLDDGMGRVCNDYKTPAIQTVNRQMDNIAKTWNKMLNDHKTQKLRSKEQFTPDPRIGELQDTLLKLAQLEEKMNARETVLNVEDAQTDSDEMVRYISAQIDQFHRCIRNLPNAGKRCANLLDMKQKWQNGSIQVVIDGSDGFGKAALLEALAGGGLPGIVYDTTAASAVKVLARQAAQKAVITDSRANRSNAMSTEELETMIRRRGIGGADEITLHTAVPGLGTPMISLVALWPYTGYEDRTVHRYRTEAGVSVHVMNANTPLTAADRAYIDRWYLNPDQFVVFTVDGAGCTEEMQTKIKAGLYQQLSQKPWFSGDFLRNRVFFADPQEDRQDGAVTALRAALKNVAFDQNHVKACTLPVLRCMCQIYGILCVQQSYQSSALIESWKNLNNLCMLLFGVPLTEQRRQQIIKAH